MPASWPCSRPRRRSSRWPISSTGPCRSACSLIAAGTILGGVWADYSWGRFWGWDPKEVWALITLLVYLVPLHGRFAGWVNTFGLVVASIVCFLSVVMAWYGVNFVLGVGLHSYGFVDGGSQGMMTVIILAFWPFRSAATGGGIWATRPFHDLSQPNRTTVQSFPMMRRVAQSGSRYFKRPVRERTRLLGSSNSSIEAAAIGVIDGGIASVDRRRSIG